MGKEELEETKVLPTEPSAFHETDWEKKEQELLVQQMVLEAYEAHLAGEKSYSLEEVKKILDALIKGK
ncbi:MAG: hypothetical protein J5736_06075 [Bacilli bacterium]|nr:hypothetical protein [Bacilli bacterium]